MVLCPRTETLQSGVGVSGVQEPRKRCEAHCQKENDQDNIKNRSQKGQRKGKERAGMRGTADNLSWIQEPRLMSCVYEME